MRVALFFDGKNHMKDLRRATVDRWIDHGRLASWVVDHVGGGELHSAYYFTGIPNPKEEVGERRALSNLLEDLEKTPGFFVRRFNRRANVRDCPHCSKPIAYTEEKMVDTALVSELIMLAVRDAFDVAVVFSGDLDVAPGMDAVHALGKKVWIATFGDRGLSRSLARSAWSWINLADHLDAFCHEDLRSLHGAPEEQTEEELDREMLRELWRAEDHFGLGGGFVGAHYFMHRWKGHGIPSGPDVRRQSCQRLIDTQQIENYEVDGKSALRSLVAKP